jgi:hypothetical protein
VIFAIVEWYDRSLSQYDAIGFVSMLVDSSKSRKALVAIAGLAETKMDKTLYFWSCWQADHARKGCPLKPKRAQNPRRKSIVSAKKTTKGANNQ